MVAGEGGGSHSSDYPLKSASEEVGRSVRPRSTHPRIQTKISERIREAKETIYQNKTNLHVLPQGNSYQILLCEEVTRFWTQEGSRVL